MKVITRHTKRTELPKGKYLITCENYSDNNRYWLIDGQLAKKTSFNSLFDLSNNKTTVKKLKKDAIYSLKEIGKSRYNLYNL